MLKISICIIMKNEEKNIEKCLSALHQFGFGTNENGNELPSGEVVVVDTGSTDNSVNIAKLYTNSIYYFSWCNDFAKAKNYAIQKAKYDYVLIIDADEYMSNIQMDELQQLILTHSHSIGKLKRANFTEENGIRNCFYDSVERLFDRRLFHYEKPIHEQVVPISLMPLGYYDIPISLDHVGYLSSKEDLAKKAQRNNDLLFLELEKEPENPYLYFQIAQSYMLMRDYENACKWYEDGLGYDIDPNMEYAQMMVIGYGECLMALNRSQDALALTGIYDDFSHSPDYIFLIGQIYMQNNMYLQAYGEFLKCLNMTNARSEGVTSYYSYHNIGVINEILGNTDMAIQFYKKANNYSRSIERLKELQKNTD